jgi:hypothetical protein
MILLSSLYWFRSLIGTVQRRLHWIIEWKVVEPFLPFRGRQWRPSLPGWPASILRSSSATEDGRQSLQKRPHDLPSIPGSVPRCFCEPTQAPLNVTIYLPDPLLRFLLITFAQYYVSKIH